MKFTNRVRIAIAAAGSFALALGISACSRDYTAAYVYANSSANGTISAYAVDYQSGELTQISGSPFSSQCTNPGVTVNAIAGSTTVVVHPNQKYLYVLCGTQQSEVEAFGIGTDGKLYGLNGGTVNISGTYPTAAAIDPTGMFLYVTFSFIQPYGPNSLGRGGISIFPINQSNFTLGTPTTVNVGNNPVAIAISAPTCTTTPATGTGQTKCTTTNGSSNNGFVNSFVYVVDQEGYSTAAPGVVPHVLGFAQNTTTGALTFLTGSSCTTTTTTVTFTNCTGYRAGVTPSAIAIDPTGRYVYVTDKTSNQIIGYQIATTGNGSLTPLVSSPYTTGLYPVSITIDPRGKYVYTANYNSNTVSAYSLNTADGSLGGAASVGNFTTATGPTCVTIEPALGIYLYTSNYLDASISGAQLSPNTGQLNAVVNTPFPAGSLPSCVVAVANGSHASSIVNP